MTNRLRASSEWARGAGPILFKHHKFPQHFCCILGQMDGPSALGMLPDFTCLSAFRPSTFGWPARSNFVAWRPYGVFP